MTGGHVVDVAGLEHLFMVLVEDAYLPFQQVAPVRSFAATRGQLREFLGEIVRPVDDLDRCGEAAPLGLAAFEQARHFCRHRQILLRRVHVRSLPFDDSDDGYSATLHDRAHP